ncbi:MAG: CIA30 family protein [Spirochaetales bacterium]|nr:CIA30 family protein [Spirochaetales bacterium]
MNKVLAGLFVLALFTGCATNAGSASAAKTETADVEAVPQAEITLVDDFDTEDLTTLRYTYNDKADGGDSVVLPAPGEEGDDTPMPVEKAEGQGANGSDAWLKMTGNVTTKFQYGFAGMGVKFNKEEEPVDISGYTGMMFWVKGDGQKYRVEIITNNIKDFCYFGYTFNTTGEWTQIKIPFKFIMQETWGEAKAKTSSLKEAVAFKFQTRGQPLDSFELNLDDLVLYKE